jgi:pimeloyl-ACP methyl ester carboxylesterase
MKVLTKRRAGVLGAVVGVAAAGVAAGVATERYLVRRSRRGEDRYADEPFDQLAADEIRTVETQGGIELYVEIVATDRHGTGDLGIEGFVLDPSHLDDLDGLDAAEDVTLVFVHGFCLDMGTFHFQRRALEGRYRMVFYDQPGHGKSGRIEDGEYTIEDLAAALDDVVADCAPTGRIVLIGHSMGGMAIMGLAERSPELFATRVAGAVLISTSAGELDEVTFGLPDLIARVRWPLVPLIRNAGGPIAAAVVDRARKASTDLAWLLTRKYGFGTERPSPSVVSYVEKMNSRTSIETIARYLRALYGNARLLVLDALRDIPVLIVCGDTDVLTPLSHSEAIAEVLPEAELEVIECAGHVALLEYPDQVNDALDRFLYKVAS